MDAFQNFAYSRIAVAPAPPTTGGTLTVAAGDGGRFAPPPFNAVVCPAATIALAPTAEIVRVTAIAGDVLTIVRAQEGSTARAILAGDQIYQAFTKKLIDDLAAISPGSMGVWQAYTPIWANGGTPVNIGNGVKIGRYALVGKTCHFHIEFNVGGTTNLAGAGVYSLSLPVAPVDPQTYAFSAWGVLGTGAGGSGTCYVFGSHHYGLTPPAFLLVAHGLSTQAQANWGVGTPVQMVPGNTMNITGTYEVA